MGPKDPRHGEAREITYPATEGDHFIDFVDTAAPDTARANSEGSHLPCDSRTKRAPSSRLRSLRYHAIP